MLTDRPRRRFAWFDNIRRVPGRNRRARDLAGDLASEHSGDVVEAIIAAVGEALGRRDPGVRRLAAGAILTGYVRLDEAGRRRFFHALATRYGADQEAMLAAAHGLAAVENPDDWAPAERRLRAAMRPRYTELLAVLSSFPVGVKLLVDLRADLLACANGDVTLLMLDDEFARYLSSLFGVGLLELRRITWEESSAALLERLIAYEAVHEITGWDDLKRRLDSGRRCFAFVHPAMPDEPLVFVEIALTKGLTGSIADLLDEKAPSADRAEAEADTDTAIFYSITNCQPGLAGVNLGNELIKLVVQKLRSDLPQLQQFATLSPISRFRAWAERVLIADGITSGERQAFGMPSSEVLAALADFDPVAGRIPPDSVREGLMSMAARYLLHPLNGRAQDPVENFHLSNGARIERLNWLANPAPYELLRSYGLMVNYRYESADIEANAEAYLASATIASSNEVQRLVR